MLYEVITNQNRKAGLGDECRGLFFSNLVMNGESSMFHAVNRNKQSYKADLKNEAERQKVYNLVKQAVV